MACALFTLRDNAIIERKKLYHVMELLLGENGVTKSNFINVVCRSFIGVIGACLSYLSQGKHQRRGPQSKKKKPNEFFEEAESIAKTWYIENMSIPNILQGINSPTAFKILEKYSQKKFTKSSMSSRVEDIVLFNDEYVSIDELLLN